MEIERNYLNKNLAAAVNPKPPIEGGFGLVEPRVFSRDSYQNIVAVLLILVEMARIALASREESMVSLRSVDRLEV